MGLNINQKSVKQVPLHVTVTAGTLVQTPPIGCSHEFPHAAGHLLPIMFRQVEEVTYPELAPKVVPSYIIIFTRNRNI